MHEGTFLPLFVYSILTMQVTVLRVFDSMMEVLRNHATSHGGWSLS